MAFSSFWSALTSPTAGTSAADRLSWYAYLDAWEAGEVFTPPRGTRVQQRSAILGETLKAQYRLYRQTRLVWNPVPDLTDFWGSALYPGVLLRRDQLKRGSVSAIPLADDLDEALHRAIDQVWWWSGMPWLKYYIPYLAARHGGMLLKVVDDVPGRKVYFRPVQAALVADLELSPAGDVLGYATEETITPATGEPYVYREEVSKAGYRTFRDGKLYDFSGDANLGAARPNLWGFVPACWVPHQPADSVWGQPAIGATLPELLEINSLQSMQDDGVARGTKPIWWFATDSVTPLAADKRGATSDLDPSDGDRESITAFRLSPGATSGKLDPSANIADIAAYIAQRKAEFYRHFPELSMWESLRARNVSGIAAEILHGDTRNKVLNVRPGTDRQLEKATQMALTLAGVRANAGTGAGGWGTLDRQRSVFLPYTLDSFHAGALDFTIQDRPLVPVAPLTDQERAALADVLLNKLGLPPAFVFGEMGVPQDVIDAVTAPLEPAPLDESAV